MPKKNTQTVETVDEKGTPPENRVATPQAAFAAYQDAVKEAEKNDLRFGSIRGIYDGFPPIDPGELESQGLQDAPNVNLKQHQAKVNSYVSTWLDINTKGELWYDVKVKTEHCETAEECEYKSERLTEFFNDAIKEWEDDEDAAQSGARFIFESAVRDTQMGLFGIGIAFYGRDHIDWRWRAIPTRKVIVPSRTRIMLDNCPALFVEDEFTVTELYDYVRDEKSTSRWDRQTVLDLLYKKTASQGKGQGTESFGEWQNRVRNNESFLTQNFAPIELVHVYIQEFNTSRAKNGISHMIVPKHGNTPQKESKESAEVTWFYKYDRQFKSFSNILVPFCDSCGPEGDWYGVKGFGDLIYDGCHFNNLMFCNIALGAIIGSLPMFQGNAESDRQKMSQIVFSRLGILFPDVNIAQFKLNTDLSGSMAILSESNRILNTNTRIFPQNDNGPRGDTPTATQVTFDRQDQAQFTSLQVQFYRMTGADRLGYEMYRRLSSGGSKYPESWPGGKAAKRFRERCEKAKISDDCRTDVKFVRSSRSGGTGNMGLDSMKADEAMKVATPGRGQMNARKQKVKALYGPEMIEAFVQDAPPPMPEDVVISLENAVLQSGKLIHAFGFQPHDRHLGEPDPQGTGHLGALITTEQAAAQMQDSPEGVGAALDDAIKLSGIIEAMLGHVALHVDFMREVPAIYEDQIKEMDKLMNDVSQFTENLTADIASALQRRSAEQPTSPEHQAIIMKAQSDREAKMIRAQGDIEVKRMSTIAKIQNQAETSASRHRIREQEAAVNLGIKTEAALIDQERDRVKIAQTAKTRAQANVERNQK